MKWLGLAVALMIMPLIPDSAAVSTGDAVDIVNTENSNVENSNMEIPNVENSNAEIPNVEIPSMEIPSMEIPDMVGMSEADALAALEGVTMPDGSPVEVITSYTYTSQAEAEVVYGQTPAGGSSLEGNPQVHIAVSLGEEPNEILASSEQAANTLTTFGLASYVATEVNVTESRLGIDWNSVPASYEFNWDNSDNCWKWGVWIDNVCYKTPTGTYSTDVRHKMQLYCDGKYIYLHIVLARELHNNFIGNDYQFWLDGQAAYFQILDLNNYGIGTHEVTVQHRNYGVSSNVVPGALAYVTKYDSGVNPELEMRIPLSEFAAQNPNIDLDTFSKIDFYTPNLMYRKVTASGASTLPMASAGVALLLIPGSTVFIKKRIQKKKTKEANE